MQVADSGIQGARTLVESYNRDKQQWLYPPPIRFGYILPCRCGNETVRSIRRASRGLGLVHF